MKYGILTAGILTAFATLVSASCVSNVTDSETLSDNGMTPDESTGGEKSQENVEEAQEGVGYNSPCSCGAGWYCTGPFERARFIPDIFWCDQFATEYCPKGCYPQGCGHDDTCG